MKTLTALALLFAFAASQDPRPRCPPNQEYNECGTACPPTCKTPNPHMCTEQCVRGCFCIAGLVKNESGNCINPKDCPGHTCPKNQVWNPDGCGNACTERCPTENPMMCPMFCRLGGSCECIKGYCRNEAGACIPTPTPATTTQGPRRCGRNERWDTGCVHPTPLCQGPNCPNNSIQVRCAHVCQEGGCVCKDGFYRDDNGRCVRLNRCNAAPDSKE